MRLPSILSRSPSPERRAWAGLLSTVLNVAIVGGLAVVALDRFAPPQHLPWRPLRLIDPPGLATPAKLMMVKGDPAACRRVLEEGAVRLTEAPARVSGFCTTENSVRLRGGLTPLRPAGPTMNCAVALQYALWERHVVRPAAEDLLGAELASIEHFGTYACRRIYGRAEGAVSQHARAAALDVSAFVLSDGRRVTVLGDWSRGDPAERAFLRRVRDGACGVFGGVLSPDYNAAHADHFHLDDGAWRACR